MPEVPLPRRLLCVPSHRGRFWQIRSPSQHLEAFSPMARGSRPCGSQRGLTQGELESGLGEEREGGADPVK